jgi:hypothetical protein
MKMKHTCLYSQTLARPVYLFALTLLLVLPSAAQTDLQIMVSGPWAYVASASDKTRIFLVAPPSAHHQAFIFAGTNAADFRKQGAYIVGKGLYQLDFDWNLKTAYTPTPQEAVVVPLATVNDLNKVSAILSSMNNYVISLPVPDDYSTYVDPLGQVDGYSESKVNANSVTQSIAPKLYTTWMVLHYSVKSLPVSLQQTGTANKTIPTRDPNGKAPGGISIVLGDPNLWDYDPDCDSISLESLQGQDSLWGLTEFARFPKQDKTGKQRHYLYDYYGCSDSVPNMEAMKHSKKQANSTSGGGADCHSHQYNINKAGPPPPP